nr:MAG TPA: hypothetical protein [Caudoviricetes sp.]
MTLNRLAPLVRAYSILFLLLFFATGRPVAHTAMQSYLGSDKPQTAGATPARRSNIYITATWATSIFIFSICGGGTLPP